MRNDSSQSDRPGGRDREPGAEADRLERTSAPTCESPEPSQAEASARDRQFVSLYNELIAIARRALQRQPVGHTLQATALVHEAYLRIDRDRAGMRDDREGFLALAARVMRCVLVDHARRRACVKRVAGCARIPLDEILDSEGRLPVDRDAFLALDDALRCLGRADPMLERIVELRFVLGLTVDETAAVLKTPKRTIERKWQSARAFIAGRVA